MEITVVDRIAASRKEEVLREGLPLASSSKEKDPNRFTVPVDFVFRQRAVVLPYLCSLHSLLAFDSRFCFVFDCSAHARSAGKKNLLRRRGRRSGRNHEMEPPNIGSYEK